MHTKVGPWQGQELRLIEHGKMRRNRSVEFACDAIVAYVGSYEKADTEQLTLWLANNVTLTSRYANVYVRRRALPDTCVRLLANE